MDLSRRSAGVLWPVPGLPDPHPCGGLGQASRNWLDQLHGAGVAIWQLLPLGPTRARDGHSPYSAACAFSLATDLLSPADIDDGLARLLALAPSGGVDPAPPPFACADRADRDAAGAASDAALRRAHALVSTSPRLRARLADFRESEASWLLDAGRYAAASALEQGRPWWRWPDPLRARETSALQELDRRCEADIERYALGQLLAHETWTSTRAHAARLGIRILGDLPIYVHADSPDVWAHRDIFRVDPARGPTHFGGVPPDAFSEAGQLWRNPTFDWGASASEGHAWWSRRVTRQLELFDDLRLDHFRGFCAFWEVPADARDARGGRWVEGPGASLIDPWLRRHGAHRFLAEDLGIIDAPVEALLDELALPGMRVLQFALEGTPAGGRHVPSRWPTRAVAYTGTHDNQTLSGWLRSLTIAQRDELTRRLPSAGVPVSTAGLLELVLASEPAVTVIPATDLLDLDDAARINTPGVEHGNWTIRLTRPQVTAALRSLGHQLRASGRVLGRADGC